MDINQQLLAALKAAALRIRLANSEGQPILSAWLPDAEAAIAAAEAVPAPAQEAPAPVQKTAEQDRAESLEIAFDVLTSYLTDHCPADCPWEVWDSGVDEARSAIAEAIECADIRQEA